MPLLMVSHQFDSNMLIGAQNLICIAVLEICVCVCMHAYVCVYGECVCVITPNLYMYQTHGRKEKQPEA